MANYLLLYHGGGMPETDEAKSKVMAAWGEWMQQVGENLVDAGNPCSNVQTVSQGGVAPFLGDRVTGYSIVKADSMEAAVKCAQMVPLIADGGSVDVYETFNAM
jgi:hypothetical protein